MKAYESLYRASCQDPVGFWMEQAKRIEWFAFPERILSRDEDGLYRWYEGGKLNSCYLAVDRHVAAGHGDRLALIYDSPVTGTVERYTYSRLLQEVSRLAGGLRDLGVERGDRVVIYMPMIPQAVFAMLACARIGAVHSVVFGGFAPHELAKRIDDAQPKALLTASCGIEGSKIIPYKPLVDKALARAGASVRAVLVWQRPQVQADLQAGRDYDWASFLSQAAPAPWLAVKATDPLYIIYTSGTTGRPKGVVRDNGGHAVAMAFSMDTIYGAQPGDVFWAASDVGWVVGHSYIVYAPLIHGCTTILYEGKPVRTPDAGSFWRVIEEHGVRLFFTAPTAFRAIIREDAEGELLRKRDVSSLQRLYLAGERCDVTTLQWLQKKLGVPVIDHWWQTESGWPMLAIMAGVEMLPVKPGSAGKPVCGYQMEILDTKGKTMPAGAEGALAIRCPLPPGTLPNLWRDTKRFKQSYLSQYPGFYFTGDGAYRDEDGYYFITGRMDDVINVAGHRLSTASLEEVVAQHPQVAECAVVGAGDELKGQVPIGIVVLKSDATSSEEVIEHELVLGVREAFGAVACFKRVLFVKRLPKTRSGKILRGALRAVADGRELPSLATIEDRSAIDEIAARFGRSTESEDKPGNAAAPSSGQNRPLGAQG